MPTTSQHRYRLRAAKWPTRALECDLNVKRDLNWLILKMATLPITRQDWAFVFEICQEADTKIPWKVDPNTFSKFEIAPNASRVVRWFMKNEVQ
jgi:hypothetical protein